MNNIVFVGLGSNKDDRLEYLRKAVAYISEDIFSSVDCVSSIYESLPYGVIDQGNYYNAVAKIKTELSLIDFFILSKNIELKIGRTKSIKWGPREIDIDILFFNNLTHIDERITVPHKEFLLRDFVFVPMLEIDPDFLHPVLNKKISDLNFANTKKNIINKISFTF